VPKRPSPIPEPIQRYLDELPPEHRAALVRLRKIIQAAAPEAEEVLSYKMPAFRLKGMLVYYASFKDHCSFFVGSSTVRERFSDELERFETGKGTLQFTPDRPIPAGLITRLVKARVAENTGRRAR
jgi:uncharacterized protein YdhG (YjbR/CyaY superfamily)